MDLETLRRFKPQILAIAAENGVSDVRVFGSVARGDAGPDSDVDLLVKPLPKSGWGFFAIGTELEELLGVKVDVVSENAINRHIREQVLKEAIPI